MNALLLAATLVGSHVCIVSPIGSDSGYVVQEDAVTIELAPDDLVVDVTKEAITTRGPARTYGKSAIKPCGRAL